MGSEMDPSEKPAENAENMEEERGKLTEKVSKSEKSVKRYQWFVLRLLLIIVVLWILLFKIVGLTHMPSEDMYPRVDAGDLVLFYRLDKDVHSQDIVVIEKSTPENAGKQLFISRVIAVGGDTVEISSEQGLVVNGNAVRENGIFYRTAPYAGYTEYPLTLAEDEVFVLSDSREQSSDSRYFGPVKKSELEGTVITIVRRNKL